MHTELRSTLKTWAVSVRRFCREKPRRAVAVAIAAAVVSLTLGIVLTLPRKAEIPSVPESSSAETETPITHAPGSLDAKLAALKTAALADPQIDQTLQESIGYQSEKAPYVVFLSATDGTERAMVLSGRGKTAAEAWNTAEEALRVYIQTKASKPIWIKADVVDHVEKVTVAELNKKLKASREGYFRQGIAFDEEFENALLEAELNASGAVDYDANEVSLPDANIYLANADRPGMSVMADEVLLFTTKGYFCDEADEVFALSKEGSSYGRRTVEAVDKQTATALLATASDYLVDVLRDDGQFLYGYLPASNRRLTSYNILRHCGTIWSLCQQKQLADDDTLKLPIDQALEYLKTQIRIQDNAAFVVQEDAGEIRLGGNGLAILALTEYAQAFDTKEYDELITQLADGILRMLDTATGQYTHVLNADDYSVKEQNRTVFYDGEATFALVRAYAHTKTDRFLDGAKVAADRMVEQTYEQYGDHWVAYAMNELTKYLPEERYFLLALKNAQENLDKIAARTTTSPTGLELLMATFEMVERIETEQINISGMTGFDTKGLVEAIGTRTQVMLDGYFYPELAMYMEHPQRVVGTFFVRQDRFRIRIDDVQHNIGGYYAFICHYDAWKEAAG